MEKNKKISFRCSHCIKFFDSQHGLNIHVGRVHKKISKDSEPDIYDKLFFQKKKHQNRCKPKNYQI